MMEKSGKLEVNKANINHVFPSKIVKNGQLGWSCIQMKDGSQIHVYMKIDDFIKLINEEDA